MNHFGTLSALQPILISAGIIMHRCRRRFDDKLRYYLEDVQTGSISPTSDPQTPRRGFTLSEILNWLYLTGQYPVAQDAQGLLTQLDHFDNAVRVS
jgi:hypothetical protein